MRNKAKEGNMKKARKLILIFEIILLVLSLVYIIWPGHSFAKDPDCKYGWNSYPGEDCKWDYRSNCVECNF